MLLIFAIIFLLLKYPPDNILFKISFSDTQSMLFVKKLLAVAVRLQHTF